MNPDTLERLVIDRDAGQLSADTLELLSAYLQAKPEAAYEARQIEDTLRLAKQALSPNRQPALPPQSFKPELLPLELEKKPSRRLPQWPLALAACFACGLFVGWFWLRSSSTVPTIVETHVITARTVAPPPVQSSSFWSADRVYRSEVASASPPSSGVVWESPVKRPQLKSPL